jgi:DNA polymerase-1
LILLIDGDVLLYRFGFKSENSIEWSDTLKSEWLDPLPDALADTDRYIQGLLTDTKTKDCIVCLSGSKNFRYDLLSTYKHNRKDKPKPVYLDEIKEHLKTNYKFQQKDVLEADDCMGILATKFPDSYIIATIDKDLRQIPGHYFNFTDRKLEVISQFEADRFFYEQCLSGDTVDGYSGVPGIGKVKAGKIVSEVFTGDNHREVWKWIVEEYEKKNLTESYALTQARMARILRVENWDGNEQKVKLWKPCQ